jgi:alpha-mannosidase
VGSRKYDDGGIYSATISFLARDVPAMGHIVYHVSTGVQSAAKLPPSTLAAYGDSNRDDSGFIENEFYKAVFNLWNGEMTSLVLKPNHWEALSGPGNVVAREEDGGDLWQLYGSLNGARFTAMKEPIPAPRPRFSQFSNESVGGDGSAFAGPVFAEFHMDHPFGKNHFSTRVRLYPGMRRIDVHTEILNQEQMVRYRVQFPTSIRDGHNVEEIAFGAIERPRSQEFPAQNWIDYGGGEGGLALLNRGLPGSNVAGDTMLLSLARSTRLLSYDGIGPDDSSDSALELGKRLAFDYAIVPHAGTWQEAQVYRAGLEFNNPLIVRSSSAHAGTLAPRWGMLEVSSPQAVVSALKPSREGEVALRIYEATGQPARGVRVSLTVPLKSVREANLIEDPGQAIAVQANAFSFDLHPYEIKTFLLHLETK